MGDERLKGKNWYSIITTDGTGYYGILPMIFIYQDYDYSYLKEEKFIDRYGIGPIVGINDLGNGKMISKYYMGTALLMLPFFQQ